MAFKTHAQILFPQVSNQVVSRMTIAFCSKLRLDAAYYYNKHLNFFIFELLSQIQITLLNPCLPNDDSVYQAEYQN